MGRSRLQAAVLAVMAIGPALSGQSADAAGPGRLRVFILAGQSNMEGHGKVQGEKGTLEALVKDPAKAELTGHVVDAAGRWVVRGDVWIWYNGRKGDLTADPFGRGRGPLKLPIEDTPTVPWSDSGYMCPVKSTASARKPLAPESANASGVRRPMRS